MFKNEFVVVASCTNKAVIRFMVNTTYADREQAIIAGQNFCRDFKPDLKDHTIYFRTVKEVTPEPEKLNNQLT